MDFSFTEEQDAVAEAAEAIFAGRATVERVQEVEATDDRVDHDLWAELAGANLLGLAVPEAHGGSGLGIIELCLVLQAQGRTVAPVPLWADVCLGALPVARFGSDDQQAALLPGVVSGQTILTAALEQLGAATATHPEGVTAAPDGDGWTLTGRRLSVPAGHVATHILVPAATPDGGTVVAIVEAGGPGVTLEPVATTSREMRAHLALDGAAVAEASVLGDLSSGAEIVAFTAQHAMVGLAALQLGLGEAALTQTAEYVSTREQFGRPLSTNQGVAMRAGDAYIDLSAMRTTMWQAAWRLSEGMSAADEVAVAKYWAAEGGHRVVHATQHLHGGMGADVSYPIHRYFLWTLENGATLGSGTRQLVELGQSLAASAKAKYGERGLMATATVSPTFESVSVGDALPPLDVPLTRTLIVATAIASRDYQDVHHDPDLAVERGSPDIFMNILTTNGFVGRFVTDWAGPDAVLTNVSIRLGAPNYPGDTMSLTGTVSAKDDETGSVTVDVVGANSRGDHVTGTVTLVLPRAGEAGAGA